MQIYLPIAEMSISGEIIFLLGTFVGFLSGMFGVGGGFLSTPFLIFIGIPPAVAVGTQASQLVASGMAGTIGHWRKGNVDLKIGGVMLGGGIIGSFVGILIFKLLQYLGQIDLAISILYIFLLCSIGTMMMIEVVGSFLKRKTSKEAFNKFNRKRFFDNWPYKMHFPKSRLHVSALMPGGIGFLAGVMSSIMGIGGGFFIVPAMIYILGMSTLLAAGTSLFQIIFIAASSTIMHATMNNTVDLLLATILMIGGVIGAQIGVYFGRKIQANHARFILAVLVLVVGAQLAFQLFIQPSDLYSTVLWEQ